MIAGLQTRDDMAQVYKIVKGVGGVNSEQWFKTAENARKTRRTDPTNIQIQAASLEIRRNFFSHRVTAA